jgi:single-strand DNA-binding protein
VNRVEIMGGLTRDAEFRFLPSGMPVAEWTVAIDKARYDSQTQGKIVETTFVKVTAWASLAETLMDDGGLHQGDVVYVIGELSQREIEKKDGSKERKTGVTAHVVQVVRRKAASNRRPSQATPDGGFTPPPGAQQSTDPWTGG